MRPDDTNTTNLSIKDSKSERININETLSNTLINLHNQIERVRDTHVEKQQIAQKEQFLDTLYNLQKSIQADIEKKLRKNLSERCFVSLCPAKDADNKEFYQAVLMGKQVNPKAIATLKENIANLQKKPSQSIILANDTADMLSKLNYQADNNKNFDIMTQYGNKQFADHSSGVKLLKNVFSVIFAGLNFILGTTLGFFDGLCKGTDSIMNSAYKKGAESFNAGKEYGKHLLFQSPTEKLAEKGRKFLDGLKQSIEEAKLTPAVTSPKLA